MAQRPRRHRNPLKARYHRPGTAPGTYDVAATRESVDAGVAILEYDRQALRRYHSLEAFTPRRGTVRWIRVGSHPPLALLEALKSRYAIDPMALEDVVVQSHRPKFSTFDGGCLLSLAIPRGGAGETAPLNLYLSDNTLVTFFDDASLFGPIEQRLASGSRLRGASAHDLAYALLDLAVDLLFPLYEQTSERLERLEEELLDRPGESFLREAHAVRRELLVLRRTTWATREVVGDLLRHWDSPPLRHLRPLLQDSYEHVVTIVDLVETQREIATSLVEIYLSLASNRLNDVMRVLTIIATLFIPPTFVAGIYGMNFRTDAGPWSMPELEWPYGYLLVLGIMGVMITAMLVYFRRKRWL
ncbi:MAG: magnesium/cobalt transporter CorA [Pseudomonadota bacterium]